MQVHKKANRYLFYLLVRTDNTLQKKMWNFLLYCCRYVVATTPKSLFELDEQNFKQHVQTFTRPQQKLTHTYNCFKEPEAKNMNNIYVYFFSVEVGFCFLLHSSIHLLFTFHSKCVKPNGITDKLTTTTETTPRSVKLSYVSM